MLLRLLLTLILSGLAVISSADSVTIQDQNRQRLTQQLEYLADPDAVMHIGQLADSNNSFAWQAIGEGMRNYVVSGGVYWFRVTLNNPYTEERQRIVEVPNPAINVADLYLLDSQGGISVAYSDLGIDERFTARGELHRHLIATLTIPANDSVQLIWRIESYPTLKFTAQLWQAAAFAQHDEHFQLLHGMVYGSLLVMMLYNLFLFVSTQQRSYLYYVLFLLSSSYMIAADQGHLYQYIGSTQVWAKQAVYALVAATNLIMFALFCSNFLQLQQHSRRYLFGIRLTAIAGGLAMILNTAANSQLLLFTGLFFASSLYILALLAGLRLRMQGFVSAGHFVIAILMLASALIASNMASLGLVFNQWTLEGLPALGTTLMMVFFSLALADRINQLQRENSEISQSISKANSDRQKANTEILKARQEHLRLEQLARQSSNESQSKSDFIATMSHEIRTPMSGIMGMTELLKATELDSKQTRYLNTIEQSGHALLQIINDLQDFSRIEAGKLELELQDFNLQSLLDDCVATFALRANEKQLNFIAGADPAIPQILHGDVNKLRQIILNLLSNAIKFTDSGDVILTVASTDRSAVNWQELYFTIEDSGIGLTEEEQQRLFTPFQHADASTYGRYGGSGLGLAISRQLAELMDGKIGVDSQPGKGSRFWFTARVMHSEQPDPALLFKPSSLLQQKRVLLVDPHPQNQTITGQLLTSWDCHWLAVDNAATALTALTSTADDTTFDLVIIEQQLADRSGTELAQEIHRQQDYGSIPCLLLTFAREALTADKLEQAGIVSVMDKPLTSRLLYDSMLNALEPEHSSAIATQLELDPALAQLRVLLVDDNQVNQMVIAGMLNKCGIQPVIAGNGIEALEQLQTQTFDLILMDCEMPEMDGFEASKQIRLKENAEHRSRIIALSAHTLSNFQQKAEEAGMDNCLSKPISFRELVAQLQQLPTASN